MSFSGIKLLNNTKTQNKKTTINSKKGLGKHFRKSSFA
jgi:hypothetical protein